MYQACFIQEQIPHCKSILMKFIDLKIGQNLHANLEVFYRASLGDYVL